MLNIYLALCLTLSLCNAAIGSVPIPPSTKEQLLEFGQSPKFDGVYRLIVKKQQMPIICSAVAMKNTHGHLILLTAAHCLEDALYLYLNDKDYKNNQNAANAFFIHPYFFIPPYLKGIGDNPFDFGAAVFYNKSMNFPGYALYQGPSENLENATLFFAGWGYQADGKSGKNGFQVSSQHTIYNSTILQPSYVALSRDNNKIHPYGVGTSGDSGGPLIVENNNQLLIAGVMRAISTYGDENHHGPTITKWFLLPEYTTEWVLSVFDNKTDNNSQNLNNKAKVNLQQLLGLNWKMLLNELNSNPLVQFWRGELLLSKESNSTKKRKEGLNLIKSSAKAGYIEAQEHLAQYYHLGIDNVIAQDYNKSIKWHELAAENGSATSMLALFAIYSDGLGTNNDQSKANDFLRSAAILGLPTAQYELGLMYHYGNGVPKDPGLAYQLILNAANHGVMDARKLIDLSKNTDL